MYNNAGVEFLPALIYPYDWGKFFDYIFINLVLIIIGK